MRVVSQSAELIWITPNALQVIEAAGRTAYKSEDKITPDSAIAFVRKIMERGHDSVIEHASASIRFVCDRGVSHELVRHRLFSFTQESTRYCNYGSDKFGNEIAVVQPPGLNDGQLAEWTEACECFEDAYNTLIKLGSSPQIARSVLPTCLKTEIVVTGNFREWRHFFKLRTAKSAHPQMQELAGMALNILNCEIPELFNNLK